MTLELDGKFVVAVWMIPLDQPRDTRGRVYRSGDWLATFYKKKNSVEYGLHYRFRYHVDGKVHDSEDAKSEVEGTFPGKTEAEAMAFVENMAEHIAGLPEKSGGKRSEIHKLIIRSADPDVIVSHLKREKFFHTRPLTEEEKKAYLLNGDEEER